MLNVTIPPTELFDDDTSSFSVVGPFKLQLEHSLVSISKWEAKTKKAFLGKQDRTNAEMIEYVRCMTTTTPIKPEIYEFLTRENIEEITTYINDSNTASVIPKQNSLPSRETITSELIYFWMVSLKIPFECQKWHLNRLLTLIQVCNIKNSPPKKRSRREILAQNKALNDARRAQFKTNG